MKRDTRSNVGGQSSRLAKGYVAHGGVARGVYLLFPSAIGVRLAHCGITNIRQVRLLLLNNATHQPPVKTFGRLETNDMEAFVSGGGSCGGQ